MSRNDEVAAPLEEFADLLEATGVEYKPTAYRRAAENVREHTAPIENLAGEGEDAVAEIDRVGDAIASKIVEYFETGSIEELEALRSELPADIGALTAGRGRRSEDGRQPLRGARDHDARRTRGGQPRQNRSDPRSRLRREDRGEHPRQHPVRARPGSAPASATRARSPTPPCRTSTTSTRSRRSRCAARSGAGKTPSATSICSSPATRASPSSRRSPSGPRPTRRSRPAPGRRAFARAAPGWTRIVDGEEFGAALQYFTGSRAHNVAVRNRAIDRGLKLNEYGLFDISDVDDPDAGQRVGERVVGRDRGRRLRGARHGSRAARTPGENNGEVAAAAAGELPNLVETKDLRGDLHTHTDWSDGGFSIAEMIEAAAERGYDAHAVTRSPTTPPARGSSATRGSTRPRSRRRRMRSPTRLTRSTERSGPARAEPARAEPASLPTPTSRCSTGSRPTSTRGGRDHHRRRHPRRPRYRRRLAALRAGTGPRRRHGAADPGGRTPVCRYPRPPDRPDHQQPPGHRARRGGRGRGGRGRRRHRDRGEREPGPPRRRRRHGPGCDRRGRDDRGQHRRARAP